jgi:hypothetical protein
VSGIFAMAYSHGRPLQQGVGSAANTRDLRHVGFDEAVTWCFAVVWRRAGLLVRVWVSIPYPFAGAPRAFYCA